MAHLYKSRLQNYAQKRNISFPTYACEMQGPPHARLFKARVTIDGATFEGPEFCTTLKDAEHAAAKVAFTSLSPAETQEDDCLYKSLLQELAQKKGLPLLPVYETNRSGPPHMPSFSSSVEIAGERFTGPEARTKKQSEMNAAKVAYTALTEGGPRVNAASVFPENQMAGPSNVGSSEMQMGAMDKKEPKLVSTTNKTQTSVNDQATYSLEKKADKEKGEGKEKHMPPVVIQESQPKVTPNVVDATQLNTRRDKLLTQVGQAHEGSGSNTKKNQKIPVKDSGAARAPSTKIVIRPHEPGMTYDGPIHISDDEWVAMKVELEN